MTQEYINPLWISENITDGMTAEDIKTVIACAPRVEVDTDLLHSIANRRAARENKVAWALGTANKLVSGCEIKTDDILMNVFFTLMGGDDK